MIEQIGYGYKNMTATGNASAIPCTLGGIFCASSTSGTVAIYDSATTGTATPVIGLTNLVAGTFYPIYAGLGAGCYVVLGGVANITVMVA